MNLNTRVNHNGDEITTKDLIYQYLRELELVQRMIETLERRINTDIQRVEIGLSQHNVTNRDDMEVLETDLKKVKEDLNALSLKVTNMVNDAESKRVAADHKHDIEIRTLQLQMAGVGIGSGVISGLLSEPFLNFLKSVILALLH